MTISPKTLTRLIDYTFEIDAATAAAMRWQHGVGPLPLVARFFVACRGEQEGKARKWTPHLRRIVVNDVQRDVPAEYGADGNVTADCAGGTAEAAADALCHKYLTAH